MAEMTKFRMFFYICCFTSVFTTSSTSRMAFGITVMIVISIILLFFLLFLLSGEGRKDKEIKRRPGFQKIIVDDKAEITG